MQLINWNYRLQRVLVYQYSTMINQETMYLLTLPWNTLKQKPDHIATVVSDNSFSLGKQLSAEFRG